ncbi:MAG: hypothetical protein JWN38_293 [Candidatus Saccharibacteria bacterium]|nr:hypothetical protein [Candidatus Saccharibacteria bacterium]
MAARCVLETLTPYELLGRARVAHNIFLTVATNLTEAQLATPESFGPGLENDMRWVYAQAQADLADEALKMAVNNSVIGQHVAQLRLIAQQELEDGNQTDFRTTQEQIDFLQSQA